MKTAVIVTTYQRPACLARSLPQIVAAAKEVGAPVLVVDDGTDWGVRIEYEKMILDHAIRPDAAACADMILSSGVTYLRLPSNRGLAGALNIGLAYLLADPEIEVISYFQDDVEVDPLALSAIEHARQNFAQYALWTGHDAIEHENSGTWLSSGGVRFFSKKSCRATHMHASRAAWKSVFPIPSRGLGLPSKVIRDRNFPEKRGTGSGVDWWVVRDSPNRLPVLCVPGLVRTFAWKREDSCWDNEQIAGEDAPLSRAAIQEWVNARS